jgi:hypothetical protein
LLTLTGTAKARVKHYFKSALHSYSGSKYQSIRTVDAYLPAAMQAVGTLKMFVFGSEYAKGSEAM